VIRLSFSFSYSSPPVTFLSIAMQSYTKNVNSILYLSQIANWCPFTFKITFTAKFLYARNKPQIANIIFKLRIMHNSLRMIGIDRCVAYNDQKMRIKFPLCYRNKMCIKSRHIPPRAAHRESKKCASHLTAHITPSQKPIYHFCPQHKLCNKCACCVFQLL